MIINNAMKNLIIYLLIIFFFFQSCMNNQRKDNELKKIPDNKLIKITTYTGNALIFFNKEYHSDPHVYVILISEKDSNVFKQKTFDVPKAVRGKCSIYTYFGYKWSFNLIDSKEKDTLNFNICNVIAEYYVKVWISYDGFIETRQRRNGKPLITDSCERRSMYYDNKKSRKDIKYKIFITKDR